MKAQRPAKSTTSYVVKKGETLYGIANRHHVKPQEILQINHLSNVDYIQEGQTLIIPNQSSATSSTTTKNGMHTVTSSTLTAVKAVQNNQVTPSYRAPQMSENQSAPKVQQDNKPKASSAYAVQPAPIITYKEYKVKRKDTAYSLAKANNITIDQLFEANPQLKEVKYELKKGTVIRIPSYTYPPNPEGLTSIRVAVILPFIGNGLENERSVEFYRGVLMGVSHLKKNGVNISINTYNEPSPQESVALLMNQVTANKPDLIIGPLYPSHFTDVTAISSRTSKVVIPFSSKVPQVGYRKNLFVINTPAEYEIEQAAELFTSSFNKKTTVVTYNVANGNKNDLSNGLTKLILKKGYRVINTSAYASEAECLKSLSNEPNKKLLLLPNDASAETLTKLFDRATYLRNHLAGYTVSVLGYEQWIPMTEGSFKNAFHQNDVYLLTPNYFYPYTEANRLFCNNYKKYFGQDLLESSPRMAPLGYDLARGMLEGIATYGYDYNVQPPLKQKDNKLGSIQTNIQFKPVSDTGGYINHSMWLIRFKNDMSIVKISR